MKLIPATTAVPRLLMLLTWLSIRAINGDAELYERALGALDHFELAENALRRDVLTARTGVLRNYDRFVQDSRDGALDGPIAGDCQRRRGDVGGGRAP